MGVNLGRIYMVGVEDQWEMQCFYVLLGGSKRAIKVLNAPQCTTRATPALATSTAAARHAACGK